MIPIQILDEIIKFPMSIAKDSQGTKALIESQITNHQSQIINRKS